MATHQSTNQIKVKSTFRYNLGSDGGMLLEDCSARSKNKIGDRTFKIAAHNVWNILLENIYRTIMIFLRKS